MTTLTTWKHLARKPKSSYTQLFAKDHWVAARVYSTAKRIGNTRSCRKRLQPITACRWKSFWKLSRTVNRIHRRFLRIGSAEQAFCDGNIQVNRP